MSSEQDSTYLYEAVDPLKKQLQYIHQTQLALLDEIAAKSIPPSGEFINPLTLIINNPGNFQRIITVSDKIDGLKGYNPLYDTVPREFGTAIVLDRDVDAYGVQEWEAENLGIDTDIRLDIGVYGDTATLEEMKDFIRYNPHYWGRLLTSFSIDDNGNAVKSFHVPDQIFVNPQDRLAIEPLHGESRVFDELDPRDLELIEFALSLLKSAYESRDF